MPSKRPPFRGREMPTGFQPSTHYGTMSDMSSASYIKPEDVPISVNAWPPLSFPSTVQKPVPMTSLQASARRITSKSLQANRTSFRGKAQGQGNWQEDAWDMYDLVGEQRFLIDVLAGRLSQAKLYVGKLPEDLTEDPQPTEDAQLQDVLDAIGDGLAGRSQLVRRLGINLLVPGEAWLVGIPSRFIAEPEFRGYGEMDILNLEELNSETIEDLQWGVYSIDEVEFSGTDRVSITLRDQTVVEGMPEDFYMVRVWSSHPRKAWEATSPTKASLPVLRELVGLTMHISAQVDSRLAGAGLLIVPSGAVKALRQQIGIPEDSDEDPFTDALMEAMLKPIEDRSNASAVVPLVITAPDDSADKFQHITFDKPLDTEAKSLRDEAIRRLALGQDAPPELLLGMSGMNHWGAWLVREDVVTTHLEPPLALICDALTTQYLRPVMEAMGYSERDIRNHVVWYDVDDLVMRPNRSNDAEKLYDKGVLSDEALRKAAGFDESDAPETGKLGVAELTALDLLKRDPNLAINQIGVRELVDAVQALLDQKPKEGGRINVEEQGPEPEGVEEPESSSDAEDPSQAPDSLIPETNNDPAPFDLEGDR